MKCAAHAMHVANMSPMIQIRHVPEQLHKRLKARAAAAGMSLSDYLRVELERTAARLTPTEVRERLSRHGSPKLHESPADAVRAERDAR